jgi:hypothetical protein
VPLHPLHLLARFLQLVEQLQHQLLEHRRIIGQRRWIGLQGVGGNHAACYKAAREFVKSISRREEIFFEKWFFAPQATLRR